MNASTALVEPFPVPGRRVRLAYRELQIAESGTDEQRRALGDLSALARPWDPATCTAPDLRWELWQWLDAVASWLNHQYVFDPLDAIPACWPRHRHLVHELAVLADQRHHAGRAYRSAALEDWHRSTLTAFIERMRHRVAEHCEEDHPRVWPATGRHARYLADPQRRARHEVFRADLASIATYDAADEQTGPRLAVVDTDTGEVFDGEASPRS